MKFHIVSDSSCDLGAERARRLGVELVSFYVALGDDRYYREEKDISTHAFYQRMADNPGVFPRTSMPTIQDYLDAFRPLAARGMPILCICLTGMSTVMEFAAISGEEKREKAVRLYFLMGCRLLLERARMRTTEDILRLLAETAVEGLER